MIFQEYALVERLTVMENVLWGGHVQFWRSFTRRFPGSDIATAPHFPQQWTRPPTMVQSRLWRIVLPLGALIYLILAVGATSAQVWWKA